MQGNYEIAISPARSVELKLVHLHEKSVFFSGLCV